MPTPSPQMSVSADNQSVLATLLSSLDGDYFGVITLAFQHGKIVNIRKEQNFKAAEILSQTRNSGKPNDNSRR